MRRTYSLFLLILVFALSSCSPNTTEETREENVYPVDVMTVSEGKLDQSITLTGTVMPAEQAPVFSVLAGEVSQVYVSNGDIVRQGDVLLELKAEDINLSIAQAQAGLEAAQAQLESAKAMRRQAIRQAEQQLEQARQAYNLVQASESLSIDLNENSELAEALRPLIEMNRTQRQLDVKQAEMALKTAELALEQAQGTESIQAAEAAVRQAEVGLKMAKEQQKHTRITAPVDGEVTNLAVHKGQVISPQMPLMTIVDLSQLSVQAAASEAQLKWLQTGQEVNIVVSALDKRSKGVITYISPVPGQQSRSYPFEVKWVEVPEGITPGMTAQIELNVADNEPKLLVPVDAVLRQNETYYVYVVEAGVARQRAVTPGEETSQWMVIESGLTAGEQIVVQGQFSLYDGARVEIREERPAYETD